MILSSPSGRPSAYKSVSKNSKLMMFSSYQSFGLLVKVISQWCWVPFHEETSCTVASLKRAILKRLGNWTLSGWTPHHVSCQNNTLLMSKRTNDLKTSKLERIDFQHPTLWAKKLLILHQPNLLTPYLDTITFFNRASSSMANLQSHLVLSASFIVRSSLIP